LSDLNFSWAHNEYERIGVLQYKQTETKILSIHAHSKNLLGLSPLNYPRIFKAENILTGEYLQSIANITLSTNEITNFHGRNKINTPDLINLPVNPSELISEHGQHMISIINASKIMFVYTHLIPYFKSYILPWLTQEFILISHNSDDSVNLNHLDLLNNPLLRFWFAQNCEIDHVKLISLPIGIANSQWGANNRSILYRCSQDVMKRNKIYLNYNPTTHPSRLEIINKLSSLKEITIEANVEYSEYVRSLADHKFVICPRGNGIDTHRFWEAQYLGTIPIILKSDWTAAYSNLPVVTIESWESLCDLDLDLIYIQLTCSAISFERLLASYYFNSISKTSANTC
jgi:hypothetical protein